LIPLWKFRVVPIAVGLPSYCLIFVHRKGSERFRPEGARQHGNVLAFGDKRVYVAGDTENIPEMKALAGIDIAFLPMNLPCTMTPEMATDAARLVELLRDRRETEMRIRQMQ
jgi:L-ascorbate metabolism protein UlaG (beta-lactamase superfamily)